MTVLDGDLTTGSVRVSAPSAALSLTDGTDLVGSATGWTLKHDKELYREPGWRDRFSGSP
jgi:hypothetical protein